MKKCLSIVILLTLFAVSCTHAPATKGAGTGETGTTSETATNVAPAVAKTEAELGILHPLRFADDVKIYQADDVLHKKAYEVPYRLDEHRMLIVGHPLARGKLSAQKIERTPDSPDYTTTAVGYYDLEKGKFVPIAEVGMPGYETADDVERVTLFPLDEGHILCELFWGETLEYAVYTIADGTMREFVTFGPNDNFYYIDAPHTVAGKFTLVDPTPGGEGHTHVYDTATMKKILTHDGGTSVFPWKDDVVYLERIYVDDRGDQFVDLYLEEHVYSWHSAEGKYLLTYGVGTDPDGVYALISTEKEREKDEDSDASDLGNDVVPYFELYRMSDETRFFEMCGSDIDVKIAGPWIAISRPTYLLSEEQKPVYLLVPGAHEALRITPEEQVSMIELLAYEPYAVIYPKADDSDRTVTVTTYAPREKAR